MEFGALCDHLRRLRGTLRFPLWSVDRYYPQNRYNLYAVGTPQLLLSRMSQWDLNPPLLWLELFLIIFTPLTLVGSSRSRFGVGGLINGIMMLGLINPLMKQFREFKQLDSTIFRFRAGPRGKQDFYKSGPRFPASHLPTHVKTQIPAAI